MDILLFLSMALFASRNYLPADSVARLGELAPLACIAEAYVLDAENSALHPSGAPSGLSAAEASLDILFGQEVNLALQLGH